MARRKNKHLENDSDAVIQKITKERKLKVSKEDLKQVKPLTENQRLVFESFPTHNLFLHGMAGVGKSFLALYLALSEVLDPNSKYEKVIIIRSVVPTVDIGFLKGNLEEKTEVYETPYKIICNKLLGRSIQNPYDRLKEQKYVDFMTTSYIRGIEFNNAIVIFDEVQNGTFHELDSVMTRCGQNCKIMFLGDYSQTDLKNSYERRGLFDFLKIIDQMPEGYFKHFEFTEDDIVRSGIVKAYLIAKNNSGIGV